jgi:acyl-CoA synthetase (AMP-forming)/AMP-acid ligase II
MKDYKIGHVGIPVPACEIRLRDVAEMNYFAKDRKGEVCIRGNNVFCGYLRDLQRTYVYLSMTDTIGKKHSMKTGFSLLEILEESMMMAP